MPSKTAKKDIKRGGEIRGAIVGLFAIAAMLAAYAAVIKKDPQYAELAKWILMLINLAAAVLCGLCAGKGKTNNRLLNGVLAGAILAAVVIIFALLCVEGTVEIGKSCEILLITLCGSAIGSILNLCISNKKLRKRSRRKF